MIPRQMQAIVLDVCHETAAEAIGSLRVGQRPVPTPGRGQVLVKVEAAPCNPSDLMFLQGKYGVRKTLPTVPGWEGAGHVVASGGGLIANWLKGKRVACAARDDRDGTWAEYCVADAAQCIPLKRQISIEQAASLIINPMTAMGLLDSARRHGYHAAIQTAGASQLGRMLIVMAADLSYPLVSIVRREAQAALLKSLGAEHVLNSEEADFPERLKQICGDMQIGAAFDAVAGPMTGTLLNAMSPGSTVFVYGGLSEQPCGDINPVDLIFHDKTVTGFFLAKWLQQRGVLNALRTASHVQRLLADGRIKTQVQRRLSLPEVVEGLKQYVDHMTDGKVLIVP
jgi:NADPH:quinone reductase-like Zn-dependent oxidoreductase